MQLSQKIIEKSTVSKSKQEGAMLSKVERLSEYFEQNNKSLEQIQRYIKL